MQTIQFPSVAEQLGTLPAQGTVRHHRQLYRLIDRQAAADAADALLGAASVEPDAMLATVLTSAVTILRDITEPGEATNDDARERLREMVSSSGFLSLVPGWITELREAASSRPETGACTVATALDLWSWTFHHLLTVEGPASFAISEATDALGPLLAARCLALEVSSRSDALSANTLPADLCHVYTARAAALAGAACAELVFGYRRHLIWDAEGCSTCYASDELDQLEAMMPGIASGVRMTGDVIEADGTHPMKAGPCSRFNGLDTFIRLRNRLDGCLAGARLAKDRAALSMAALMSLSSEQQA